MHYTVFNPVFLLSRMLRTLLLTVIALLYVGPTKADCARPLLVHIDLDPPSTFLNKNEQVQGMDVEMLLALGTEMNCAVDWHTEVMSGARALRSIEEGQTDAVIRASKTPERELYAHFSLPYRDEVIGIYALKSTQLIAYKSLKEAMKNGLTLIAPASGYYGEEFEQVRREWMAIGRMTQYKNAVTATQLLFAKPMRGEIVLVDSDVFYYTLGAERVALVFMILPRNSGHPAKRVISNPEVENESQASRKQESAQKIYSTV